MSTTLNMLGAFVFRNWLGPSPGALRETTEVLSARGANYQAVRTLGIKSEEFQRESIVDVPSIVHGRALFQQYQVLMQTGAEKLVWNSWDFDNEQLRAKVLDVELVEIKARVFICGALFPGNRVDLRVRWKFILVPWT